MTAASPVPGALRSVLIVESTGVHEFDDEEDEWVDCEVIDTAVVTTDTALSVEVLSHGPLAANGRRMRPEPLGSAKRRKLGSDQVQRYGRSSYRGVHRWSTSVKTPWKAMIYVNGKKRYLDGSFETEEQAARAYDEEARKLGRPESQMNFPIGELDLKKKLRGVHRKVLKGKCPTAGEGGGDLVRFCASIRVQNKSVHLGTYETEEIAALAYDKKARELGRDESQLNFPKTTNYSRVKKAPEVRTKAPEGKAGDTKKG